MLPIGGGETDFRANGLAPAVLSGMNVPTAPPDVPTRVQSFRDLGRRRRPLPGKVIVSSSRSPVPATGAPWL
jgi:hypothetical protein